MHLSPSIPSRILVVDDEGLVLSSVRRQLKQLGADSDVLVTADPQNAMQIARSIPVDLMITDLRMPKVDGPVLLRHMRRQQPTAVRAILSGQASTGLLLAALPLAQQYLEKPCPNDRLATLLEAVHAVRSAHMPSTLIKHLLGLTALPADGASISRVREALARRDSDAQLVRLLRTDLAIQVAEFRLEAIVAGHPSLSDDALAVSPPLLEQMISSPLINPVTVDHPFMLVLRTLAIKTTLLANALRRQEFPGDVRGVALACYLGEFGLATLVGSDSELWQRVMPFQTQASAMLAAMWGFSDHTRVASLLPSVLELKNAIDEILPFAEAERLSASTLLEILSEVIC